MARPWKAPAHVHSLLLVLRWQLLKKAKSSSCCLVLSAPAPCSPHGVAEPTVSLGTGTEARQGGASSVLVLALLPSWQWLQDAPVTQLLVPEGQGGWEEGSPS